MNVNEMLKSFSELRHGKCTIESEGWSESDTRSKFIDTVLINCLGWSESDIRRELSADRKRLDYLLSTTRPTLVVEAKKAKVEFPIFKSHRYVVSRISNILSSNPSFQEPMLQVANYCWRFSAPLAVLTNGKTYVLFLAVRTDGIKWDEGNAIILSNIFDDKFDFSDLYNLLSRHSVLSGRLLGSLMVDSIPISPKSVLSTYSDPNSVVPRNPIGLALEPILQEVFSDVTREDSIEVLENCYVLPAETSLRSEEFESLLLDKPPKYVEAVLDIRSRNSFEKFQKSIKDYLSRKNWSQTILVIGGIGVGKTMFLRRFFTLKGERSSLEDGVCSFFVDFRKPGLDPRKIPELIYERIREQIEHTDGQKVPGEKDISYDFSSLEGLQQVFWPQMQKFLRGPQGQLKIIDNTEFEKARISTLAELQKNDREFVRGVFRVLRERYHRNVCVILDNADQCVPEYQEAVYVFSRTLEETLSCLVIVALREEWYWYFGRGLGPLSAYHDIVYHIPAPRVRDVLAKRLDYSITLLSSYPMHPVRTQLLGDIDLEAHHLTDYLKSCRKAFFDNEEITVFYECVSNGAVRKGLDIFLNFLRSGHTHVDEYLKAIVECGNYIIQLHQVFKSISRGTYQYYSSRRSLIPNIFMPITGVSGMQLSYFSRYYLVNFLSFKSKDYSSAGEGFVPVSEILNLLNRLGLSDDISKQMLGDLLEKELIEPEVRISYDVESWKFAKVTPFGLFLVRRLAAKFTYLEAVMLDTPINDHALHTRLSEVYTENHKPNLENRLKCVEKFVNFLQKQEDLEQMRVQTAGLADQCPYVMEQFMELTREDFKVIRAEIEKSPFV